MLTSLTSKKKINPVFVETLLKELFFLSEVGKQVPSTGLWPIKGIKKELYDFFFP